MLRHNGLDDVQLNMLSRGIVALEGEVDGEMACYVQEAFARLLGIGSPDITLVLSSNGGSVSRGLNMFDIVRLYPGKVVGVVPTCARSMAAIVLQACNVRQAARYSKILIHHISRREIALDELRSPMKMRKIRREMEADQELLYQILADRTTRTIEEIRKRCALDQDMSAQEALDFRLIDEII